MNLSRQERRARNLEVAAVFTRLGFTAFGGPAAHVGMFRDEVVKRRKWVDDQHFLDLLGATNLIPGPNSTEMAIHLGFVRAGWSGLLLGGLGFIVPAMLIVLTFAWLYQRYGSLPEAGWLLYGVKPVIIAIILQALWSLGRKAFKSWMLAGVGVTVLLAYFLGVDEIPLLFCGGLFAMFIANLHRLRRLKLPPAAAPLALFSIPSLVAAPFDLGTMFLIFLKIGAVLYGSGYVLLAFLRSDFVTRLGWLTDQQLIDSIAIGQVTPGPLFTTATFIGYQLGGTWGAVLATAGIFLPSFIFVMISNPLIPRLRDSPWTAALLDGINVASLGLMAAVTLQLGQAAFVDGYSILLGVVSAGLLLRYNLNSTWLVLGGALAGLLSAFF